MRNFISRTLLLSTISLVLLLFIYMFSVYLMRKRAQSFLKLNKDTNIVFSGDSNIECAINDSLISNSINIAQSGEAYFYTFFKLKTLLESNNQIKIVFLGYSFHDIELSTEKRWLFKDEIVISKLEHYNYLMDISGNYLIFKKNPNAYVIGIRDAIMFNFRSIINNYFPQRTAIYNSGFGGYLFLNRAKLNEDSKLYLSEKHFYSKGDVQLKYLQKISSLCHNKSVKLILLNTPKHNFYLSRLNKGLKDDWFYYSKLNKDSVMNYSEFSIPDSCFGDLEHLNYRGSRLFSEFLNRKLHIVD